MAYTADKSSLSSDAFLLVVFAEVMFRLSDNAFTHPSIGQSCLLIPFRAHKGIVSGSHPTYLLIVAAMIWMTLYDF